ncbi:MAG: J domain-containing protein [Kiloniellales bacterium]|nr:J domain-containing protein [Kiloniellales bacterium]
MSKSTIEVRLPETEIRVENKYIRLPPTQLSLPKFAGGSYIRSRDSHSDDPCEWRRQPFYPKLAGKAYTGTFATFYTEALWESYSQFYQPEAETPKEPMDPMAALLGVPPNASRKEVSKAFRANAKKLHPDCGGSAEAFQRLLEARDTLIAKKLQPVGSEH